MNIIRQELYGEPYYLPDRDLQLSSISTRSSQDPRRCSKCAALSPHNLIRSGLLLQHHQSFQDFEAAALDGCALCRVLLWNVQFYECTPEERRDRYETLRRTDKSLLIGWDHESVPEHEEYPPHLLIYFTTNRDNPDGLPLIADGNPLEPVTWANVIEDGAEPSEYE